MFNKQQFPIFRCDPTAPAMRVARPGLYVMTANSSSVTWQLPAQTTLVRKEREIYFFKNETVGGILTITCGDGGNIFDAVNATSLAVAPGNSAILIAEGTTYAAFVTRTLVSDTSAPATNTTFTMSNDDRDGGYWAVPAAGINQLTVALPSEANSRLGQRRYIGSSQAILTLIVTGATTIYGASPALAAGEGFTLTKVAANTWAKL